MTLDVLPLPTAPSDLAVSAPTPEQAHLTWPDSDHETEYLVHQRKDVGTTLLAILPTDTRSGQRSEEGDRTRQRGANSN